MADFLTKEARSKLMSRIRPKGNLSTEVRLLGLMKTMRLKGWRRHYPIPGKPDFAFPNEKLAVFVDGCFWHGCPRCYKAPKSNKEFWLAKIRFNKRRARTVNEQLKGGGWKVLRIWEHSLIKSRQSRSGRRLQRALYSSALGSVAGSLPGGEPFARDRSAEEIAIRTQSVITRNPTASK